MADSKVYTKLGNGAVRDLTQDTIYNHPGTKQCNYEPDLSSCMIKTTISASRILTRQLVRIILHYYQLMK